VTERLLLAEDESGLAGMLVDLFGREGYVVDVAADGQAMLHLGLTRRYDVLVVDRGLPAIDGLDVLARLRSRGIPTPALVLTARGTVADRVAGLDAGADDYLAKPFDAGELRARVDVGRRVTDLQARLREAHDALAHEAMHDPLTGALNRRAFADVLTSALAAEQRHHHGLAVGLCDVDEFKKINDAHGHQVGDEVLCGLVQLLSSQLRGYDTLSRLGGDEFAVLATHVAAEDVRSLYDRACQAVANTPIATRVGDLAVTISIGVSTWKDGQSGDAILVDADAALYRAKAEGRNRVAY
jgi:diguanylate cyclase (GGDEF)-like protein